MKRTTKEPTLSQQYVQLMYDAEQSENRSDYFHLLRRADKIKRQMMETNLYKICR